jgi:hypothetical protein
MAGSLSINKRKTYAADARGVLAACSAKPARGPASRSGAAAPDGIAVGSFHGFAR